MIHGVRGNAGAYTPPAGSRGKECEEDSEVRRHKPRGLDVLCRCTNFSERELKMIYRGFKQECPRGIVEKETFKNIYQQYFPQGNSAHYATFIFNTMDKERTGHVSFEQFIRALSVLSRGSPQERLSWVFSLYDINSNGHVTRDEMFQVVSAVYDMMGKYAVPPVTDDTAKDHVDEIFDNMDKNGDGVVSVEDFMSWCSENAAIVASSNYLDTVFF